MVESMMVSSFWGPVTSTTELCEENFAHSSYIAEFYNTISNIPCIILALIGLLNALRQRFEKRFSVLHISNMILAIGNIMFHATLQHVAQQSDETPMIWELLLYLYVLYSADWHYRSTMPTFLFLYATGFAITHSLLRLNALFKVQYILLCLLCVPRMYKYYIHTKDAGAKRIAHLYLLSFLIGGLCWSVDRFFCKKLSGCSNGILGFPIFSDCSPTSAFTKPSISEKYQDFVFKFWFFFLQHSAFGRANSNFVYENRKFGESIMRGIIL